MRLHHTVVRWLPDLESRSSAIVVAPSSRCACSSSGNSNTTVFAYRTLGSPLLHIWSIYNVSGASDLPDSASLRLCNLVGPPARVTDSCTSGLRFQLSKAMWQVRTGVRSSVVLGRWSGRSRYICHCVTALLMLTCLVCS